jgi:GT2 family glycosyltransferase
VQDLVNTLAAQDYQNCHFLVVDQTLGRNLELEAIIARLGSRFSYIRLPKPNLPAARNVGIRNTSGEIILFIDDDVDPYNDLIKMHVRAYLENDNVGVVAGLLVNIDRPIDEALEDCRRSFNVPDVTRGGVYDVRIAVGGNMSYLRSALIEAGMFDENFGGCALCEDTDASERVGLKNYRVLLDSRIQLRHLNLKSGGCELRNEDEQRRVYIEKFELTIYRFVKRFMLNPSWESVCALFVAIRQFTLNRPLLKQGLVAVAQRQVICLRSLIKAAGLICSWSKESRKAF